MDTIPSLQTLINPASRHDPQLAWFKEARLGLFIHYSVVASHRGVTEHLQLQQGMSDAEYQEQAFACDLPKFSAAHWVDQAVAMGARYLTLVCKHLDGFCFWDTETTDFNIMQTPFGRDLVREIADECQRRDIRFCVYCSHADWHDPNYAWQLGAWGDRQWSVPGEEPDMAVYLERYRRQITELFEHYGPVWGVWFDASDADEERWQGRALYDHLKAIAPGAALSERAGYGDYLSPEWQLDESVDFEHYLVEQAISVANQGWAWHHDTDYRSTPELVDILVRMIGCGSNLLLNIGPKGDGTVPEEAVERLRAFGAWVRRHAEAVYGTDGLRLDGLGEDMRAARRDNDVYIFLRRWPRTDRVCIPGLPGRPAEASLLGAEQELTVIETGGGWVLEGFPDLPPDACAQVVKLSYEREPAIVRPPPPVQVEHWVALRQDAPTTIPVTKARLEGFRVKNFRHHLSELQPPDAAFEQNIPELDWLDAAGRKARNQTVTDVAQMWQQEDGGQRHAICDWRGVDQRILMHLEVPVGATVAVELLLRCPDGFGGSRYRVSCGDAALEAAVVGNPNVPAKLANGPDWWAGWRRLPFRWETAGTLVLKPGRHLLALQPLSIDCSVFICDLAAVRLTPVPAGARSSGR